MVNAALAKESTCGVHFSLVKQVKSISQTDCNSNSVGLLVNNSCRSKLLANTLDTLRAFSILGCSKIHITDM